MFSIGFVPTMAGQKRAKTAPSKAVSNKGAILQIRLTEEQKIAFDAAAQRLGIGLSAFARMSMIERARAEGIEVKT